MSYMPDPWVDAVKKEPEPRKYRVSLDPDIWHDDRERGYEGQVGVAEEVYNEAVVLRMSDGQTMCLLWMDVEPA